MEHQMVLAEGQPHSAKTVDGRVIYRPMCTVENMMLEGIAHASDKGAHNSNQRILSLPFLVVLTGLRRFDFMARLRREEISRAR